MAAPWFDSLSFATFGLCGMGALCAVSLTCTSPRLGRFAALLQVLLGAMALAAGVFAALAMSAGQPLAIWGSAVAVVGLYLLVVVFPSPVFARCLFAAAQRMRHGVGRRAAILTVLGLCPLLALALVYAEMPALMDLTDDPASADHLMLVEPAGDLDSALTTDQGRSIRILNVPADVGKPTPALIASQDRLLTRLQLHDQVIHMPLGWQNTNCHGFVFTAGRYCIGGSQVDAILEDNGYQPVEAPRPEDVAVYRDAEGRVVHSGIVRGVASDGAVLVESKWGQAGRFVHRHDRQPYADASCTFYRTARAGHLLRGAYPGPAATQPPAGPAREPVIGL